MTPSPTVSVVIPTFNEIKYIAPCIQSLQHQTFTDFEVIAIDKSTDGTTELCKKTGWHVFTQIQSGISAARAEGFAKAKGQIIASTNADTAVSPHWLENIVAAFTNPQVVCSYGPVYFLEKDLFSRFLGNLGFWLFKLARLTGKDHIIGENFAIRKSAYQAIGGYNLDLPTAEDVDLGYRIRSQGKIVFNPHQIAYTSNRRVARQGPRFYLHHLENYFRLRFFGSASSDFTPIR